MANNPDPMQILVVDDETSIRRLLEKELKSSRRCITTAGTAQKALAAVQKTRFDVIILDVMLPDANGIELMARFQERILAVQIILITGYGDVDDAVEAMKTGACDYMTKPFDLDLLEQVVEKAFQRGLAQKKILAGHRNQPAPDLPGQGMVGHSSAMEEIRFLVQKAAPTQVPVLIIGESGTGKNVVARQIHGQSLRHHTPLVTKNCATLQDELMRSELFGYCKGAFTGAETSRQGLLSLAHNGTLFLDEVGELSMGVQASLLRVMENQTFRPVGDKNETHVDIRFIFATNRDLKTEAAQGRFSEALFHRLNVFTIPILPLRERKQEIPVLVEYFLGSLSPVACKVSKNAMARLMAYDWPGNVRELRNVIERGIILADNQIITERCLPKELLDSPDNGEALPLFPSLRQLEAAHITRVMDHVDGNRSRAADILGISRKTLYRKLSELKDQD